MTEAAHIAPTGAEKIAGDTYCLAALTNSGYVEGLLVDTGPEIEPYDQAAFDRLAITHGHADHFAVAAGLRGRGAEVVSGRDDATLIENPEVNIRGMFSWAKPGDILVSKLFQGEGCRVDSYAEDWEDQRARAIPLPGHTLGHYGFLTRDGVLFSGDALYLEGIWARHPLPYAIDPYLVVQSLRKIRDLEFDWLVPAHGHPVEYGDSLHHIDHHIAQVNALQEFIRKGLKEPKTTEDAIAMVSAERGLSDNPAQYWLAVTTVKGYLGTMLELGELEFFVRDHSGWWVSK